MNDLQITIVEGGGSSRVGEKRPCMIGHKPWGPAAANAAKTHCNKGHAFTTENTRMCQRKRICRTCHNEKMKRMMRQRRAKDPLFARRVNLRRNYGLTLEQYADMVKVQGNLCAICRKPPTKGRGAKLYVDHCHRTGRLRGLLCNRCNSAIGLFDENAAVMRWASNYVLEAELISEKQNG